MERNKEIATSANLADSLTEQQCDVLEWASDMRHVMHKNSEALYDVNAPKHKEIKAFISDTHYSQNPNNLTRAYWTFSISCATLCAISISTRLK